MTDKQLIMILLTKLCAYMVNAKRDIWYYLKPLPAWWKLLLAFGTAVFVTVAFVFGCGMEGLLFQLFDIQLP